MQRREYRTSAATRIFLGVLGVLFLGLGMALIINGIMVPSVGPVVLGVPVVGLASGFLVAAFRPNVLVFDHTGLYLQGMFGSQRVSWDEVRAFHTVPRGQYNLSIQAVLRTGTTIVLPNTTDSRSKVQRITAELAETLRKHAGGAVSPPGDGSAR